MSAKTKKSRKNKKQSILRYLIPVFAVFSIIAGLGFFGGSSPELSLSDAAEHDDVLIRARGSVGAEKIQLRINGNVMSDWRLSKDWRSFIYKPPSPVTINDLRVHFINDQQSSQGDYNVNIDFIKVNGKRYDSEHSSTISKGTWKRSSGCAQGRKSSQWLHCNGWMRYNVPVGTVVGQAVVPREVPRNHINLSQVKPAEGAAYTTTQNFGVSTHRDMSIFEDGKELGPQGARDDLIGSRGEGRYALRDGVLKFSASDNSDPRSNGRTYTFTTVIGDPPPPPPPSPINGDCGAADGRTLTTKPTSDLCVTGETSSVSGNGPWTWTCIGSNGGTQASCRAQIASFQGNHINLSQVKPAEGAAYTTTQNFGVSTHRDMSIFEDGKELGPQGERDDLIGSRGGGSYALRNGVLKFSASDNSDPRSNGRTYTFTTVIGDPPPPPPPPSPSSVCGNGVVESGESCDDGNTRIGDGCSASCQREGSLSCYNPWNNNGKNLQNRVRRLMNSPYRTGFGAATTGGTQRLVTVTNPAATGSGTYADVISRAREGDYIVFDPSYSTYINGCKGNACEVPGSVTIDGSQPNGRYVTLKRSDITTYNSSLRFSGGNNIVANLEVDHNSKATAVAVSNGENYWLHAFKVHNPNDDSLGFGNPRSDVKNSADKITISKYQVIGGSKGLLANGAGESCRGDSNRTGSDTALNQRRSHITVIDSELAAGTRNVLNSGAYIDIIGSYIHGRVENAITRWGGQTIIRCSYVDSRTVRVRGIYAQEGTYMSGESSFAPSFCPEEAEVYLDNNLYRQKEYVSESSNPRINESGSDIETGKGGHMTNGKARWDNPSSGRAVFSRPYERDVLQFCASPTVNVDAGPEFTIEQYCD